MESKLEWILMNAYKEGMIAYIGEHQGDFDEMIELALGKRNPLCWRAAWLIFHSMDENDARIRPHIRSMIDTLPQRKDGHQRELLKILSKMDIDDEDEGYLFDHCVTLWEAIHKPPSVRYTALMSILKLAEKYPELKQEVAFLLQDHYLETLSPGIREVCKRLASPPGPLS